MLSFVLAGSLGLATLSPSEDVEATIDALIARTNELDGFSARYSVEFPDGGTGSLRFDYEAPGSGRMSLEGRGFGVSSTGWLVDGEYCTLATSDEGSTTYARFDVDELIPPALELAHEHYPLPAEDDLGPGPVFHWGVSYDPTSDRANLDLALIEQYGGRTAILAWLPAWRDQAELLELTGDQLVLSHDRFGGTIALDTGFPLEIWLMGKDGAERRFHLESLEFETSEEEGLFELPVRPAGAEDTSEEVLDSMRGVEVLPMTRQACHRRIDRSLAGGKREWNERARADAREVFAALHAEWLEELQERNDAGRASTWESTAALELPEDDSGHGADLLAIEEEVFAEVFAGIVGEPHLAAFDAAVGAILDR